MGTMRRLASFCVLTSDFYDPKSTVVRSLFNSEDEETRRMLRNQDRTRALFDWQRSNQRDIFREYKGA